MIVTISDSPHGSFVVLDDPDDCTRLHVVLNQIDDDSADALLHRDGLGFMHERDEVWLRVTELRRRGIELGVRDDWRFRFEGMLDCATRKGWLDDTSDLVVAHVERVEP